MYSRSESSEEDASISPQLPSFVDVVFILLIFFIVLSVVGFGVAESGYFKNGQDDRSQDISSFPAVQEALKKDITEFVALLLTVNDDDIPEYYVFSNTAFDGVIIASAKEYQTIRAKIESGEFNFEHNAPGQTSLETLRAVWGPFVGAAEMRRSLLVLNAPVSTLVIQANEKFSYHQILEVMRLFGLYKSVYFEVVENKTS